jgi:hypothetical protein
MVPLQFSFSCAHGSWLLLHVYQLPCAGKSSLACNSTWFMLKNTRLFHIREDIVTIVLIWLRLHSRERHGPLKQFYCLPFNFILYSLHISSLSDHTYSSEGTYWCRKYLPMQSSYPLNLDSQGSHLSRLNVIFSPFFLCTCLSNLSIVTGTHTLAILNIKGSWM